MIAHPTLFPGRSFRPGRAVRSAAEQRASALAPGVPEVEPDIETSSEAYVRRFSGPIGQWFLDQQERNVRDLLAALPGPLRIVDVGGGHAQIAPALVEDVHEVVVLGSTPSCGERLKAWTDAGRCRFDVGSIRRLPYEDDEFDVAIALRLLAHVAEPEKLIAELCRVSRRGVIVDFPSVRSVNVVAKQMFGLKLKVEGNTRPFYVYPEKRILGAFRSSGFGTTASRPQYFLPMALHRAHGSVKLAKMVERPAQLLAMTRAFGSPVILWAQC